MIKVLFSWANTKCNCMIMYFFIYISFMFFSRNFHFHQRAEIFCWISCRKPLSFCQISEGPRVQSGNPIAGCDEKNVLAMFLKLSETRPYKEYTSQLSVHVVSCRINPVLVTMSNPNLSTYGPTDAAWWCTLPPVTSPFLLCASLAKCKLQQRYWEINCCKYSHPIGQRQMVSRQPNKCC